MRNMKDLILKLLDCVDTQTVEVQEAHYKIVGSCMDFTLLVPDAESEDGVSILKTTVQHLEIVQALQRMGAIRGHDAATKQVYTQRGGAKHLWQALDTVGETELNTYLLRLHFTSAYHILEHDGDVEELVQFFPEYNFAEKQAWMWRMSKLPDITTYHARQVYAHLYNHYTRATASFPSTVPLEVQMFARWLARNDGGMLAFCHLDAPEDDYARTSTY